MICQSDQQVTLTRADPSRFIPVLCLYVSIHSPPLLIDLQKEMKMARLSSNFFTFPLFSRLSVLPLPHCSPYCVPKDTLQVVFAAEGQLEERKEGMWNVCQSNCLSHHHFPRVCSYPSVPPRSLYSKGCGLCLLRKKRRRTGREGRRVLVSQISCLSLCPHTCDHTFRLLLGHCTVTKASLSFAFAREEEMEDRKEGMESVFS